MIAACFWVGVAVGLKATMMLLVGDGLTSGHIPSTTALRRVRVSKISKKQRDVDLKRGRPARELRVWMRVILY
ncbi:MAG: hypothetical protein NVSMB14_05980 [Isosphaeraceae bacterium]